MELFGAKTRQFQHLTVSACGIPLGKQQLVSTTHRELGGAPFGVFLWPCGFENPLASPAISKRLLAMEFFALVISFVILTHI